MARGRRRVNVNAQSRRTAELAERNRVAARQQAARRELAAQRAQQRQDGPEDGPGVPDAPGWSEGAVAELENSDDALMRTTAEVMRAELDDGTA